MKSAMRQKFEEWHGFDVCDDMDIQTEVAWDNWKRAWKAAMEHAKEKANEHPAKFPDELARRMVLLWGFGVVCDPFLGSGTTGAVCAELGLPFVGIERDRRFFDMACDRIAKVGAGETAAEMEPARDIHSELTLAAFHREVAK